MQPTVGRILLYVAPSGDVRKPLGAFCTAIDGDDLRTLTVFTLNGPVVVQGVPHSEEPAKGCWSWMPYQMAKAQTERGNVSESAEPGGSLQEQHASDRVVYRNQDGEDITDKPDVEVPRNPRPERREEDSEPDELPGSER